MKLKLAFSLLIIFSLSVAGQMLPNPKLPTILPPSPQASQFARYGDIPVGHSSGIPQIDIPIYTLSTGKINIPISISYHASGFQVNEIASTVGLGWVLNAGGLIMRSIEGKPDFKAGTEALYNSPVKSRDEFDLVKAGRKYIGNSNTDMSNKSSVSSWESFFTGIYPVYDIRSDRYNYNFLNHVGVGRYDINETSMELKTIPYEPLKFTYFPANEKYQVVDTKGIVYEFAQLEYINPGGVHPEVTGWYLTKITYPGLEAEPIIFTYEQGEIYSQTTYSQVSRWINNYRGSTPIGVGLTDNGVYTSNMLVSHSYRSPLIKTIEWKNQVITFGYAMDRTDRRKERLANVQVTHGTAVIKTIIFNNDAYFGTTNKNKRLRLESILFQESGETYSFKYNYSTGVTLPDYSDLSTSGKCFEDYWGYWNGTSSYHMIPSVVEYKWRSSVSPYTIPCTDRTSSEYHTKFCVLESIVYPTKGKTNFEYEINRVSGASSFNLNAPLGQTDIVGGLRLKKRINYSESNVVTDIKEYEYSGNCLAELTYSLDIYFLYTATFLDFYTYNIGYTPLTGCFPCMITTFVSTPYTSLTGRGSVPVFYDLVKEYNGSSTNHNGWTMYSYFRSNNSTSGCYRDGTEMPRGLIETSDCDHGTTKGYFDARTEYDVNGIVTYKVKNSYTANTRMFPTGIRITEAVESDGTWQAIADQGAEKYRQYILANLLANNTYGYQDFVLLTGTTNSYYLNGKMTLQEKETYSYDYDNLGRPKISIPSSISQLNSKGEMYTKTTIYPYHSTYKNRMPYSYMNTYRMFEYPVEEKTHIDSDTLSNIYTRYQLFPGNEILPKATLIASGNNSSPKERISYHNYDSRGNPVFITKDGGENVVYLWGYNYRYPILQIQGATYAEVKAAIGYSDMQIESLASQSNPSTSLISQLGSTLRNQLSNAGVFVTSYTYKPSVGILSMTDPRGVVTSYEYDSAGRLLEISEGTGSGRKVLERFEYNLRNY